MKRIFIAAFVVATGAALTNATLASGVDDVTFTKHVAPILWKNCASCHRPGEIGPFSLLTYADAAKRAPFIAELTASRRMPPWKPEPGFGHFRDERRLSDEDIATLKAWATGGAKEGDAADLPTPPNFPQGWHLGEPDLVIKMPEAYTIAASGADQFRCFVIPLNLESDKVVAATEFRPECKQVVHHALFFLDNSGKAQKLDEADPEPGYRSFGGPGFTPSGGLGGWSPGALPRYWPQGMGHMLRKGSDLVVQVHYHPNGKTETDRSTLGIYFAKPPITQIVASFPVLSYDINIPPGEKAYRIKGSYTLPAGVRAVGITPHMHWLGRDMKVTATLPDGEKREMVWIKDWDFNWQGQYVYADLVSLPKGTQLDLEASYDNSADNPQNPSDPPKWVRYGEQTTDEMCFCWIQFVAEQRSDYVDVIGGAWSNNAAANWMRNIFKTPGK